MVMQSLRRRHYVSCDSKLNLGQVIMDVQKCFCLPASCLSILMLLYYDFFTVAPQTEACRFEKLHNLCVQNLKMRLARKTNAASVCAKLKAMAKLTAFYLQQYTIQLVKT